MRVTSRRATTMIHTRSQRVLKLAEERKFDELLEHLRADDPRYGRVVYACARDERLLRVCAGAGTPALDVIELLIEHGAEPRIVFQSAAYGGQVELLEAACERNWHSEHTYREIFEAAANGARQTGNDPATCDVFDWLGFSVRGPCARVRYFGGNMLQDSVPERNPARDICRPKDLLLDAFKDVLVGECFGAADFLLHHAAGRQFELPAGLGFGLAVAGRMHYREDGDNSFLDELISYVLLKNARTVCLDFLCTRFDKDHVVDTVDAYLDENNNGRDYYWTDAYWDDVVRWSQAIEHERGLLRRQQWNEENGYVLPHPGKEHLMHAMQTLDTVKEHLPEGEYLKLCSDMQRAYETM
jgi:hypothetical protein